METDDVLHSSLGFEKNPWCLAYYGVKATTEPRKPFAPFGRRFRMEARGFASPFGGRIGPWYTRRWPRSAPQSQGGQRTDPLTPIRVQPGVPNYSLAGSTPNYSRYVNDPIGLSSRRAMGLARHVLRTYGSLNSAAGAATGGKISLVWYGNFNTQIADEGDVLPRGDGAERMRSIETAAVAPDLFDINYYSIDPRYEVNYIPQQVASPDRFTFNYGNPMVDIGGTYAQPSSSVERQIEIAMDEGTDSQLRPSAYWLIRKWDHLLTGWVPEGAVNYEFNRNFFGTCLQPGQAVDIPEDRMIEVMAPGKCIFGGRTGYSVRLIAKDLLLGSPVECGRGWRGSR